MSVEPQSISFINQLNSSIPAPEDLINEGDDHIRLIKQVLKRTFKNFTGAIDFTNTALNYLASNIVPSATGVTFSGDVFGTNGKTWDLKGARLKNVGGTSATNAAPQDDKTVATISDIYDHAQKASYPIGSLYLSIKPDNPSKSLGFGNWSAYAAGHALVSQGANGFTAGNATGSMSVRLGPGHMAPHTHTFGFNLDTSRDGDHFHRIMGDDGLGMYLHKESYLNYDAKSHGGDGGVFWTTTNGAHTHHISHSGTTGNNTTGTSDPFNIVQPSIPIYVWVRNS